jgi:hypothetical protein
MIMVRVIIYIGGNNHRLISTLTRLANAPLAVVAFSSASSLNLLIHGSHHSLKLMISAS